MISQAEMVRICSMDAASLGAFLRGRRWRDAMEIRHGLQRAMAEFSRTHSSATFDAVKSGFVFVTSRIECACRAKFMRDRIPKILSKNPGMVLKDPQAVKLIAKNEWEKLVLGMSH